MTYDATNGYRQIMTEKWVAGYLKGWEAWNDWRRTGFPALVAAPDATDARGIPTRQAYSVTEASLNATNYKNAVTALGGSDHNYVKVWWAK
ncbi:MAG: SusD/RagB family nutrient-binding outer membrane lipoprotein [Sphingobacteriia bacterium]|nr:MAG: SusD/RagB family nutrient-binding outer membrane lipoprotein [Sphingobacteriia bacterium]